MAQVSSHKLDTETSKRLFRELARYIAKADQKNAPTFLQAFLTPTEQLMLAKRIAVVVLFHNGSSTYQIRKMLRMSSSTAGGYAPITRLFSSGKKNREKFIKTLEVILSAGMPPRGKGRWKFFNKINAR
jgi:Trp operon repressor